MSGFCAHPGLFVVHHLGWYTHALCYILSVATDSMNSLWILLVVLFTTAMTERNQCYGGSSSTMVSISKTNKKTRDQLCKPLRQTAHPLLSAVPPLPPPPQKNKRIQTHPLNLEAPGERRGEGGRGVPRMGEYGTTYYSVFPMDPIDGRLPVFHPPTYSPISSFFSFLLHLSRMELIHIYIGSTSASRVQHPGGLLKSWIGSTDSRVFLVCWFVTS